MHQYQSVRVILIGQISHIGMINYHVYGKKPNREKEHNYTKHGNDDQTSLKANFVFAQHNFDRELCGAKKRYAFISKQNNTPCFWNSINNL